MAFTDPSLLQVTKGQERLREIETSSFMRRYFCEKCGSPVYNKSLLKDMPFVDVPLVLFERDPETGTIRQLDKLLPTCHLFYPNRVANVIDDKEKWSTYPGQGKILKVDEKGNVVDDEPQRDDSTAKKQKTDSKG